MNYPELDSVLYNTQCRVHFYLSAHYRSIYTTRDLVVYECWIVKILLQSHGFHIFHLPVVIADSCALVSHSLLASGHKA